MKKEWSKPTLDVLDVSMTLWKGKDPKPPVEPGPGDDLYDS